MLFGGLSGNKMQNSNCSNADNHQKYLKSSYDKQNLKWKIFWSNWDYIKAQSWTLLFFIVLETLSREMRQRCPEELLMLMIGIA